MDDNSNKRHSSDTLVDHDDFRVAILCASSLEFDAVEQIFDEIHKTKGLLWQRVNGDCNSYTSGKIGRHNIILANMHGIGKFQAVMTARSIRATFRNISLALMVGVCSAAPTTSEDKHICLGDVIVGTKILHSGSGHDTTSQFVTKEPGEGNPEPFIPEIQSFLTKLQEPSTLTKLREQARTNTNKLVAKSGLTVPEEQNDILSDPDYIDQHHPANNSTACTTCFEGDGTICKSTSLSIFLQLDCAVSGAIRTRTRNVADGPEIFFGSISSLDDISKNGTNHDQVISQHHVLSFGGEGVDVWDVLPTIVVKSASDYIDSHKHKSWQDYAAIIAAATSWAIIDEWQTIDSMDYVQPGVSSKTEPDMRLLRKQYLSSLDFVQPDFHIVNIAPAYATTCAWLTNTWEFVSWLKPADVQRHHRIFWIKGKPDAGKSLLIKYIQQSAHSILPHHTIAAFYFQAQSAEMPKSRSGMLRSILFQLLEGNSTLLDRFIDAFPQCKDINTQDHIWSDEELENFLLLAAQQGWLRHTLILILAADECLEEEVRELVVFCENLALNAIVHQTPVYICLSSQHYSNISLQKGLEFNTDTVEDHYNCIEQYISEHLHTRDPLLRAEILRRSYGVFLWVKIVVFVLNIALDNGSDPLEIRKRLINISKPLASVYGSLFGEPDDTLLAQMILFMQLVISADGARSLRDLDSRALYLLMVAASSPTALCRWSSCGMTNGAVVPQFSNMSRGFMEISHENIEPIVNIVRETVRECLLEEGCGKQYHHVTGFNLKQCHIIMARSCLSSLSVSDYPRDFVQLNDFPHIRHALDHVLDYMYHLLDEPNAGTFLEQYCKYIPRFLWYYLRGCQKNLTGDQVLRAVVMSDNLWNDRILEAIFDWSRSSSAIFDSTCTKGYVEALSVALQRGFFKCIAMLLQATRNVSSPDKYDKYHEYVIEGMRETRLCSTNGGKILWSPLSGPVYHSDSDVQADCLSALLEHISRICLTPTEYWHYQHKQLPDFIASFIDPWPRLTKPTRRSIIKLAFEDRSLDGLKMLINAGMNVCGELISGLPALIWTIINCYRFGKDIGMVKLLLESGISANTCDTAGVPAIFFAIAIRNASLVEILLNHGANAGSLAFGVNTLHWAVYGRSFECLPLLAARGADIDAKYRHGRTPLFTVATSTHVVVSSQVSRRLYSLRSRVAKTIATLVRLGADLSLLRDRIFLKKQTLLHICAGALDIDAVGRLIKESFPLDARDDEGNTALHYAAECSLLNGCYDFMVQQGADTSLQNTHGQTPVDWFDIRLIDPDPHYDSDSSSVDLI